MRCTPSVLFQDRCRTFLLALGLSFSLGAPYAVGQSPSSAAPSLQPASTDRTVSLKQFPENFLEDQKSIWLFPVKLAHGEHLWPTIGVLGATAGFLATDAHSAPPFRNTDNFHDFNQVFSSTNSEAIIVGVPAAIYGMGLLHRVTNHFVSDSGLV